MVVVVVAVDEEVVREEGAARALRWSARESFFKEETASTDKIVAYFDDEVSYPFVTG